MTPAALQDWRKRLGLTAKAAAEALGLSINGYAAYERGWVFGGTKHYCVNGHDLCGQSYAGPDCPYCERRSRRPIPKHVELACMALEAGAALQDWRKR